MTVNSPEPTPQGEDGKTPQPTLSKDEGKAAPASTQEDPKNAENGEEDLQEKLTQALEDNSSLKKEIDDNKTFRESLTKLLGGDSAEEEDPVKLAQAAASRADQAERLLSVYTAAPAGTDVKALTDSVTFREGLAKADDVPAFVKDFVEKNPRYLPGDYNAAKNLGSGNNHRNTKKTFDDILRGR